MAYCSNCGKELPEGVRFCPSCGAAVESAETKVTASLGYAELPDRFIANLVDIIILFIAAAVISLPLGVLSFPFASPMGFFFGGLQIISWLLWIAYFTYFEGTSGQTLGKQLVNIKVVDAATGEPIKYDKAFIRNILRIIDWLPFLYIIGGLLVITSAKKQRLGDMVTGTVVVKSEKH